MNPLDELYEYAQERFKENCTVVSAVFVMYMIDKYKRHQTSEKAVLSLSNKKGV